MKSSFILLLISLSFFSCKKDDDRPIDFTEIHGSSKISYKESHEKWIFLKNQHQNSYVYQTSNNSWTGFGSRTLIRVEKGIVISRTYTSFQTEGGTGKEKIIKIFTENISNLGSNKEGDLPLTIDQLYESCSSNYLTIDTSNNTIYFETSDNGLTTLCGYIRNGCADDCFNGFRIATFDWIN